MDKAIMAPWARRPGCVLVCYAQIERGRPRDEPCPGWRKRKSPVWNGLRESLDWRELEESAKEVGVERKKRR
ncbi:hypothetical protein TNCV_2566321 [Trichonephila clavipes]|nr:hypothetical protein TNCV_2566321 [Trichonephila clavipes]